MAIKINKDLCIGCGTCEAVCGKVFKLNEETSKAEVTNPNAEDECIKVASEMCPQKAISVD